MDTQTNSRRAFGLAIARWFRDNDWPQKACEKWSVADGRGIKGPWASQISQVIHNRLDPRTIFFDALGEFNHTVAENDLARVEEAEPELFERLSKGKPFFMDNELPATSTDFFSMFVGEQKIPEHFKGDELTQETAELIFAKCGQLLDRVCLETYMSREKVLEILDKEIFSQRGEFGQAIKRAFLGLGLPTVRDLHHYVKRGELIPEEGCCCMPVLERIMLEASKDYEFIEAEQVFFVEQWALLKK